ncbi:MAG: alternative ribosome rescue aminoacyl-tRNA hydrolase ArfB [Acidobacteriota bacterium]
MGTRMLRVTDTIVVHDREMEEHFVRASGPGGQNVNKVTTAVELRFDIGHSSLPPDVKERLIVLGGKRVTAGGVLLIDSREHRTQSQNREAARARLLVLLQQAARRPKRRRPTKPRPGAREKRLASKKLRSAVKAQRGPGGRGQE